MRANKQKTTKTGLEGKTGFVGLFVVYNLGNGRKQLTKIEPDYLPGKASNTGVVMVQFKNGRASIIRGWRQKAQFGYFTKTAKQLKR